MAEAGLEGSESGVAGVAGLLAADPGMLGLGPDARVLCFLSEGPA
jgi:diaminopropionate ammonia-lyase